MQLHSQWLPLCPTSPGGRTSFPWGSACCHLNKPQFLQEKLLRKTWQWTLVVEPLVFILMCEFLSSGRIGWQRSQGGWRSCLKISLTKALDVFISLNPVLPFCLQQTFFWKTVLGALVREVPLEGCGEPWLCQVCTGQLLCQCPQCSWLPFTWPPVTSSSCQDFKVTLLAQAVAPVEKAAGGWCSNIIIWGFFCRSSKNLSGCCGTDLAELMVLPGLSCVPAEGQHWRALVVQQLLVPVPGAVSAVKQVFLLMLQQSAMLGALTAPEGPSGAGKSCKHCRNPLELF